MFPPNMKKDAGMIVANMSKGTEPPTNFGPGVSDTDDEIAHESMGHDIIKAVKMGDAKGLAALLRDFHGMCNGGSLESEE